MSKHLIKILSIYALIVLVPLIVVGSALCVTEAAPATLTIYEGGNDGQYGGKSSQIVISVGGEAQLDENQQPITSITLQKNTEVTVSFTGAGYEFSGWYDGNPQEIDGTEEAVTTDTSYTFNLRGSTHLTALRDAMQYQIQYTGTYDDGSELGSFTGDNVNTEVQVVEYGQSLVSLTSQAGATFVGWYVYTGEGSSYTGTKVANFDVANKNESGELVTLTLRPVWSNQMIIRYYDTDRASVIAEDIVTADTLASYQLVSGDNEKVQAALTPGYEFAGWVDSVGDPIVVSNIEFSVGEYAIYLSETALDYDVVVNYNALSSNSVTINYNATTGFGAYTETRAGYEFAGFEYDGTTYTLSGNDYTAGNESLAAAVIANNGLTVNAVWDCTYPELTWTAAMSSEQEGGLYLSGVFYYDGTDYIPMENRGGDPIYFEDIAEDYYAQLETNFIEYFYSDIDLDNIYIYVDGNYQRVTLTDVWISTDLNPQIHTSHSDSYGNMVAYTFKDLIEFKNLNEGADGVTGLTVRYIFSVAEKN